MYSFNSKVRYSETNTSGYMNLYSIVNYFQDSSTFHSNEAGLSVSNFMQLKKVWMISAWQIDIYQHPALYEDITITTWPYDFKGMYAYRNFIMKNAAGKVLSAANSIWIYVSVDTGRPVKITEEDVHLYGKGEPYPMVYDDRKINLPDGQWQSFPSFSFTPSYTDTNQHINNSAYIRTAEELLPKGFRPSKMRVDYKKSAKAADIICPAACTEENKITISLNSIENTPYTVIEFQK